MGYRSKTDGRIKKIRPNRLSKYDLSTRASMIEHVIGLDMSMKDVSILFGCSPEFIQQLIGLYLRKPDKNIIKQSKV